MSEDAEPLQAPSSSLIGGILADQFRLLTFQPTSPALAQHWKAYLAFGFIITGLAGIGRYWDNPRATWFQHAGLGSIAYILFLSALLWLVYRPLRPKHWRYRNVLLFVSLCSLPAWLYAIPVERFTPMATAQSVNVWFLAIVALWRVALLYVFLRRVACLGTGAVFVATLLPLAFIIVALSLLNLEHVVFELMAGIRPEQETGNDQAYFVVILLSSLSLFLLPVLLVVYGILVYRSLRRE